MGPGNQSCATVERVRLSAELSGIFTYGAVLSVVGSCGHVDMVFGEEQCDCKIITFVEDALGDLMCLDLCIVSGKGCTQMLKPSLRVSQRRTIMCARLHPL